MTTESKYFELHKLICSSETKREVQSGKRAVLVAVAAGEITVRDGEILMGIAENIAAQCPRTIAREILTKTQIEALRSPFNPYRDNLD